MSRITFVQGANLMLDGTIKACLAGTVVYYFFCKIYKSLSSQKDDTCEEIGAMAGAIIAAMKFTLTGATLIGHIYYKTSPNEVSTKKLVNQALKIFKALREANLT